MKTPMIWYSVNDKLPPPQKVVLCLVQKFGNRNPYFILATYEWDDKGDMVWWTENNEEFEKTSSCSIDYFEITHWANMYQPNTIKKLIGELK